MKTDLVSISAAAERFGVSRRTIHRDIARGRLTQHSSAKRGRGAQSLDLSELDALYGSKSKVRQINDRSTPRLTEIYDWLSEIKVADKMVNPVFVILALILVSADENSDVDFMAYCISMIIDKNAIFFGRVFGEDIPEIFNEIPHVYAATLFRERLNTVVYKLLPDLDQQRAKTAQSPDVQEELFRHAFHVLAFILFTKPANFKTVVVYDHITKKSELRLEPTWWQQACVGPRSAYGPNYGFARSVISVETAVGIACDRIATKLGACLYPPITSNGRVDAPRPNIDRVKADAFTALTNVDFHNSKDDKVMQFVRTLLDTINQGVEEKDKLKLQEAKKLAKRISQFKVGYDVYSIRGANTAKIPSLNGRNHSSDANAVDSDDGESVLQISGPTKITDKETESNDASVENVHVHRDHAMRRVVAEVFDISRQSMQKWLESGKKRQYELLTWLAQYRGEFENLTRGASFVAPTASDENGVNKTSTF